ncbi:uncharacterized protein PHALS_03291 [Plasmopara halstedii]|uniref:Uncharacterized protein n=1 Tax=Plasmopara halstedii TaxID=4781 RepID=A0A0P1AXW4_PLAHL|nr:uncharacterized protein PHALS_03291 [Plasmopara halstedii]CEG46684.1 hypothetical protein PHALS_03291 [Plasmopara halstedii]|eukprot:XP_024583053.1 hypothetical protein PHALS_03291 [Plasmopara halstedii]
MEDSGRRENSGDWAAAYQVFSWIQERRVVSIEELLLSDGEPLINTTDLAYFDIFSLSLEPDRENPRSMACWLPDQSEHEMQHLLGNIDKTLSEKRRRF